MVLVVSTVRPLVQDTSWLSAFGEVLVAYWEPLRVDSATGAEVGSTHVQLHGRTQDRLHLWSQQAFTDITGGPDPNPELDAGYRVLVDKDDLTAALPAPTFNAYIPVRPDEATYLRLITDFLIGVPYVTKSLLRGELLPAKWVLHCDMRFNYLVPMLEWRVECDHAWQLKTESLGKGLQGSPARQPGAELERTSSTLTPTRTGRRCWRWCRCLVAPHRRSPKPWVTPTPKVSSLESQHTPTACATASSPKVH